MSNTSKRVGSVSVRDTALDFTKGTLVLVMVVYHWGNFYMKLVPHFFDFLRFLTPSFIFITGWLLGSRVRGKSGIEKIPFNRRLAWRGTKLVLLFTVLNLSIHTLGLARNRGGSTGLQVFFSELFDIYISGNTGVSSFRILLPIGYLLFASSFLPLMRLSRSSIWSGLSVIIIILQGAEMTGFTSTNLILFTFGLVGLGLGIIVGGQVSRLLRFWPYLVAGYAAYLGILFVCGPYYWVQLIGVILSLLLIYAAGTKLSLSNGILRTIDLLSRYSLFAYIAQIAILQGLLFLVKHLATVISAQWGVLFGTAALMIIGVYVLDCVRRRSGLTDIVYRTVFS